ncbi:pH-response regulator protein [Pseudozyma hubeiensis SY62]|uniref:pH-response regulator protein n=1 Tax=Pseudozyma hubeiensis (strain SY62) TaxID=1305764 RepID=R9P5G9_PSEHS|nr:pH-response regulator protein [Pseudozyma hubeiensis SY62]GAC93320.1 pH-response regulator protein [Pseudozyma hubeiensis SY62]
MRKISEPATVHCSVPATRSSGPRSEVERFGAENQCVRHAASHRSKVRYNGGPQLLVVTGSVTVGTIEHAQTELKGNVQCAEKSVQSAGETRVKGQRRHTKATESFRSNLELKAIRHARHCSVERRQISGPCSSPGALDDAETFQRKTGSPCRRLLLSINFAAQFVRKSL